MKLTNLNNADQSIELDAKLEGKSTKDRLVSAVKKFMFWFLIAVGSIFIPVAHFVLVPIFLITSIVVFIKEYKTTNRLIINGNCNCVQCGKIIKMPESLNSDDIIKCDHCFQQYKVTL